MNLFEAKVKFVKIDEKTGKEKTVKETYLLNAPTFGFVEERMFKEMEQLVSGEFIVTDIKRVSYSDIFQNEGDRFYKVKVSFQSIDETTGNEKKIITSMLVSAICIERANDIIKEEMETILHSYEIVSISESPIVEVILN